MILANRFRPLGKETLAELKRICGDQFVRTDKPDLMAYGRDWSLMSANESFLPEAVVLPGSAEEVAAVLKIANRELFPVTPWGGGTGLSGGSVALYGGVVLDLRRLDRVVEIDERSRCVTVQAGITVEKMNQVLRPYGLWWPHDPESRFASTVGAAIAVDSIGTFGSKYGGVVNFLRQVEVVLPTGEIVKVGTRAPYTSCGYKLHWLFLGSEGTLGVITEATLRVYRLPSTRTVRMYIFKSFKDAIDVMLAGIDGGLDPESVHIVHVSGFLYYTNLYEKKYGKKPVIPADAEAVLAVGFGGDEEVVRFQSEYFDREAARAGGVAVEKEVVDIWWSEKHVLDYDTGQNPWHLSHRQHKYAGLEPCLPLAAVPHIVSFYQQLLKEFGLPPATGCFMYSKSIKFEPNCIFTINVDDRDEAQVERARALLRRLGEEAIKCGGTISSNRGVGFAQRELAEVQLGRSLPLMRSLKKWLDPNGILNPGKVFSLEGD